MATETYAEIITRTARTIRIALDNGTTTTTSELVHAAQDRCRDAAETAGFVFIIGISDFWDEVESPDPGDQSHAREKTEATHGQEMIKAVREHAGKHYNEGAWDYVVEAYEDEELAEAIGDADTAEEAIRRVGDVLDLKAEYRQEHIPVAGWHY